MKSPSRLAMNGILGLIAPFSQFLKTLYLFGKSDIPAAALPSVRIVH